MVTRWVLSHPFWRNSCFLRAAELSSNSLAFWIGADYQSVAGISAQTE
jgi:hypothetical protein